MTLFCNFGQCFSTPMGRAGWGGGRAGEEEGLGDLPKHLVVHGRLFNMRENLPPR